MTDPSLSLIGRTVSHYRVVDRLGSGGMGVVFKAEDTRLGRLVALKFLSADYARDPQGLARLRHEARVVAGLDHENICPVFDIGDYEGSFFIVMQLLDGETLSDRLATAQFEPEEIVRLGIEIAGALDKAHRTGVIHRDLKPGNIFITRDGHVKLLDFGLAKLTPRAASQTIVPTIAAVPVTDPGVTAGTVEYMSPEQARGQEIDERTDLLSFGAVLYEMATGRRAFGGVTTAMVFDAVLNKTPTHPSTDNPRVPLVLGDIIMKALEKDRALRYQSAAEMRADLERVRGAAASDRVRTAAYVPPASKPRFAIAAVMALGVAAAAGGALWYFVGRPDGGSGNPWVDHRLRLFLSSDAAVNNASVSADARTIVYTSVEDGQTDVFVSRAAGGARIRVTRGASVIGRPQLSPDGERILFAGLVKGSEDAPVISTTPAFGGDVVPVIRGGRAPVWSPDGSQIAFIRQTPEASAAVAVADADGRNVRVVLEADVTYIQFRGVAWSPDGSTLAVERSMGGVSGEIWTVPSKGGEPERVWQDPPEVFSHDPVFTPDGSGIVHSSNRGGATNLWLMFPTGEPPIRLTNGPGPDEFPSVSTNGTVAFTNSRFRYRLLLRDKVSGPPRELANHSSFLWAPTASPKHEEVAVSRFEPDGSWHIWIVPLTGDAPRRLTSGPLPAIYPRFSPDGNSVIYSTWSAQADRVWRVPRTGGAATALTPAREEDDAYADVSPDGRSLAFARTAGGVTRVHVAPIDGGPARPLTTGPSTTPRWSPDGKWIAYSPDRGASAGIFIVAADGTGERRLSRTGGWPVWWPDGTQIGYWRLGPDGNQEIQVVPVTGGTPTTLAEVKFIGTNQPFDVSAAGRLLFTEQVHLATEVWLMEPAP